MRFPDHGTTQVIDGCLQSAFSAEKTPDKTGMRNITQMVGFDVRAPKGHWCRMMTFTLGFAMIGLKQSRSNTFGASPCTRAEVSKINGTSISMSRVIAAAVRVASNVPRRTRALSSGAKSGKP